MDLQGNFRAKAGWGEHLGGRMTSLVCQRSRSVRKASMVCRSPRVGHWSPSGVRKAIMKQGDNEGLAWDKATPVWWERWHHGGFKAEQYVEVRVEYEGSLWVGRMCWQHVTLVWSIIWVKRSFGQEVKIVVAQQWS